MLLAAHGCGASRMAIVDAATTDAAATAADAAAPGGTTMIYAGGSDDQIHAFTLELDDRHVALAPRGGVATGANPSFLTFDPRARWLVAVNEDADAVESFAIAPTTGALTRIDGAGAHGRGPAHVSLDATGAWVMVANYGDGTAAVLPISATGHFGAATATVAPGAHAHEIVAGPGNAVVYVPCLGSDRVVAYPFAAATGTLGKAAPAMTPSKAGPRHIAIAGDGHHAWVVNELASSVTTFAIAGDGTLTPGKTVSSRPAGASGDNSGAEIAVHPSGRWLYTSNRGDNTIAVFTIGADGAITARDFVATGGAKPRHFSLVGGGRALLVANQDSGTITGFLVDGQTGALTPAGKLADLPGAQFVGELRLP
jgi:6-phosphogluconolactonase